MNLKIAYRIAEDKIFDVLAKMKRSLDNYRSKETHNEQWALEREQMLIDIAEYVETSEQLIQELQEKNQLAYNRGYKNGVASSEKGKGTPYRFKTYTLYDSLKLTGIAPKILENLTKNTRNEEYKRTIIKEQVKKTWPELY